MTITIIGLVAAISTISIVYAYGTTNPPNLGHTLGELEPGTFSGGDYAFPDNLGIGGNLDVSGTITGSLIMQCPTGFTSIESAGRQLGCMQEYEQGSGNWDEAQDDCFDTYGGKLPSTGEWYLSMLNYDLNDETVNWEWNDESYANYHVTSGNPNIESRQSPWSYPTTIYAYRCWIPA